jgi:hypothetical protein
METWFSSGESVDKIETTFYSSGGWELGCSRRVGGRGVVDSMLRFRLEMRNDWMKYYRKMKRRQRACLGFMGRKRDTAWWHDDVSRRRCSTEEGEDNVS